MAAVSELVSGLDAELVRLGLQALDAEVVSRLLAASGEVVRVPRACRSSRWMSRWRGSMRRAAVSLRRSRPGR